MAQLVSVDSQKNATASLHGRELELLYCCQVDGLHDTEDESFLIALLAK